MRSSHRECTAMIRSTGEVRSRCAVMTLGWPLGRQFVWSSGMGAVAGCPGLSRAQLQNDLRFCSRRLRVPPPCRGARVTSLPWSLLGGTEFGRLADARAVPTRWRESGETPQPPQVLSHRRARVVVVATRWPFSAAKEGLLSRCGRLRGHGILWHEGILASLAERVPLACMPFVDGNAAAGTRSLDRVSYRVLPDQGGWSCPVQLRPQ